MALIQRYKGDHHGAIVITGNTLGLSRTKGTKKPGTDNAINQFITTDISLPVPSEWSSIVDLNHNANITFDWHMNSSSAILNMVKGYTVLYAELIWGGLSISSSTGYPTIDVSQYINNAIKFVTPLGSYTVDPDPETAKIVKTSNGSFYIRSQDVTNIITSSGVGQYTVCGVPSALNVHEADTLNHAGWSLIVAYENSSLPPRNLNIYVGSEYVITGQDADVQVTGFLTPPTGIINARISASTQEGDCNHNGDQIKFGPDLSNLTALSGPNNPINNFFCSQINIGNPEDPNVGKIDTTGTFGARNSNANTATISEAARQSWDITNVDGSMSMTNDQNSAWIHMTSSGDYYVLNGLGIQIDTILVTADKSVDKEEASLGDLLTYTVAIKNESGTPQTVTFKDSIPNGTQLVGVVSVNHKHSGDLKNGIIINEIDPNQTVIIEWKVQIGNILPDPNPIRNTGILSIDKLPDKNTNTVMTTVITADKGIHKTVLTNPVIPGNTIEYRIEAVNNGPLFPSENVFINDTLPDNIINPVYSSDNGVTWSVWNESYGLGTLDVGQKRIILIRGTLTSDTTEKIINTATVTSTTIDPNPLNDSSTVESNVRPTADIEVVKTGPLKINAGEDIDYKVVVKNNGPSTAKNVVLEDPFTSQLTDIQYSIDNGHTWSQWSAPFQKIIGDMHVSQTTTVLYHARVLSSSLEETIVNTALVTTDTYDPDLSNNESTSSTELETQADISIIKTIDTELQIDNYVIYTLKIMNAGPSDALDVKLIDVLPPELSESVYSTRIAGPWLTWPGNLLLGTLKNGNQIVYYIKAKNNAVSVINNTANIETKTFDPDLTNNISTAVYPQTHAVIDVIKNASPRLVTAGSMVTYTISAKDISNVDAYNVHLTDIVPDTIIEPVCSLDNGKTWFKWHDSIELGTIKTDTEESILIHGKLKPDMNGELINIVTLSSSNADTVTDQDVIEVISAADLYLYKTGDPNPIVNGQQITYTIRVGNNGPSQAENVVFTDNLPAQIKNPTISVNYGDFIPWKEPYQLDLNIINVDQDDIIITIQGTIEESIINNVKNTATIKSSTYDPDLDNNTDTFTSEILAQADIKISKTSQPTTLNSGEQLTYILTVTNDGVSDAQNVIITDDVSQILEEPRFSYANNGPWTDWNGTLTINTLLRNKKVTIYLRGIVKQGVGKSVINKATAYSETPDPNPEDNETTFTVPITQHADLEIVKSIITESVIAGKDVIFKLHVINHGPSTAYDVVITDLLPGNIKKPIYSIDGGSTWSDWQTTYEIPSLQPNDNLDFLICGMVTCCTTDDFMNKATIYSNTPDPNMDNNISVINVPIKKFADLRVVKKTAHDTLVIDNEVEYSISFANYGPSDAEQVTLKDVLPDCIEEQMYSEDNGVTWKTWSGSITYTVLPVGEMNSIIVKGVLRSTDLALINNKVIIESDTPEPDLSNNTSFVINNISKKTNLTVSKTATPTTVSIGDILTYQLTISNSGLGTANNVLVEDPIPSNLDDVIYSVDRGINWNTWTGEYMIEELNENTSLELLLRGKVVSSDLLYVLNQVDISIPGDFDCSNRDTASTITPIVLTTNLDVKQCTKCKCICPCEWFCWEMVIKNNGDYAANNVTVSYESNIKPDHLLYKNYKESIWNNWCGVIDIGTIEAHSKKCIKLKAILCDSNKDHFLFITNVNGSNLKNALVTSQIYFEIYNYN